MHWLLSKLMSKDFTVEGDELIIKVKHRGEQQRVRLREIPEEQVQKEIVEKMKPLSIEHGRPYEFLTFSRSYKGKVYRGALGWVHSW